MTYVMVAGGLLLLLIGGEALVRSAVALADRLGVSSLLIGLTVVAFGTSAPELLVCIEAALQGASGIAIGNVVGSNIANILLVVGMPALIAPFYCDRAVMRREGATMIAATVLIILIGLFSTVSFWPGLALFLLLCGFLARAYYQSRRDRRKQMAEEIAELEQGLPKSIVLIGVLLVAGVLGLVFGANLLVNGARAIAHSAGVSEAVIGVTLVAVGTSLPELATCVVAAFRRHGDVALGNVIGSNIFNILGILGITAMVRAIPMPEQIMRFDVWVMLACALLLIPFAYARLPIGRIAGLVFLAGYTGYVAVQFSGMSGVTPALAGGGLQ